MYDYNTDNNTATITAREREPAGLGKACADGAGARRCTRRPSATSGTRSITSTALPVKHYESEWSLDGVTGWTRFSEEIVGTKHVDTMVSTRAHTSGFRYYRVRAVNQAGVPGPWSAPHGGHHRTGQGPTRRRSPPGRSSSHRHYS